MVSLRLIVIVSTERGFDVADTDNINDVYTERAQYVAHVASQHFSRLSVGESPDWPIIYIELPTGQISQHISKDDLHFFEGIPWNHDQKSDAEIIHWDGHSTKEKFDRLNMYTRQLIEKRNGDDNV